MHPILARRRLLALYLGVWVLVAGLLGVLLVAQAGLSWWHSALVALPLSLVYAFICLSAWYVARGMPMATTGAVRIVATSLIAAVVSSAGWLAIGRLWIGALITRGWIKDVSVHSLIFGIGVLLYLLSLAVSYLLATFEETREAERRALQVQVLAREAELRFLRAQIDPHFLFNSLQSISALTSVDPAAARRMCLLLAEFLRESLALGSEHRIALRRELKLIERFLDVERVRFGPRLQVEVSASGVDGCLVPPLLLLPIVENAVTHGVAHVLEGGLVRVVASRRSRHVVITVENPCDRDRPRGQGAGLGLSNVRARLSAEHGSEAWMSTSEREGKWRVELLIPVGSET
jgi:two-component system sensor histidine kinase AlgZ